MINNLVDILNNTKKQNPLIHHITNYVTVNDCANVTLAVGASPAMADDEAEVEEFVDIASALLINIGTLNKDIKNSIIKACKRANEKGVPVILDPVGVGASKFRKDFVNELFETSKISCIRGNISEIKSILNLSSNKKGADASKEDLESIDNTLNIAKELANKLGLVVAITGEIDVISDGKKVIAIKNGNHLLPYITGTGCMCSSLVASYCGASKDKIYEATILGVITMGIAGEIAYENSNNKGLGTFHKELFNAISNFNQEILIKKANYQEIK
ncbi:hydroxyethylthiazole kinase [Aliarcobacter cryaerophilus]|uniref:hydroxyethylthiazole kinase n=1 Tax=Aliarcobacter cryaerophilus TaxID=28198 RepID=UPI001A9C546A|nr:hydroxyethylthiazole kinase [Aliarcobacter cryaerophilus]